MKEFKYLREAALKGRGVIGSLANVYEKKECVHEAKERRNG